MGANGRGLWCVLAATAATGAIALSSAAQAKEQQTDQATKVPPGATWTQAYIPSTGGAKLHADILRPKGYTNKDRTPVILSIGPYFNHSGQTGPSGPVEDTPFDPAASPGPSTRFYDFETGGDLFKRGYSYVMVDLRDFGGSTGCLDWGGPGEQADVKAAVEWAHRQPWSTGKVGTYGKSYDGVTGLIAENLSPRGLKAVVAGEPVYDLYRYLYMNRVRFENSIATPALYDAIAGTPGTSSDTLAYNTDALNDTARPGCPVFNHADQQDENHDSAYWKVRNLVPGAKRGHTPLFMTQGFIENNTKPDGAFDYFNAVKAPKRGWFGQWEHVRGNDRDEHGRLRMGRKHWFAEVMRFYDHYLKGIKPKVKDPKLAVESSDGKWRAEKRWPPADSHELTATLNTGSYIDHGQNNGTNVGTPPNGDGVWTFSPAFTHTVHYAGTPHVNVTTDAPLDRGNLVVDTYDLDAKGNATLISRGAYLLHAGTTNASYDIYPNDWILPKGHRLGVLITSSNSEWWVHVPTAQSVTVKKASISLPFLRCARPKLIQGRSSIFLDDYKDTAPFPVDAATIKAAQRASFPVAASLKSCKKPTPGKGKCPLKTRLVFHLHQPTHSRIVQVDAYIDGRHVKRVKGQRVTTIRLQRPNGKRDFVVKIVALAANGQRNISTRTYHRCTKSEPSSHSVRP
ncbi:MAG: CocE/NonD family hydrolase [Thermoleophilaceae bacterium]